MKVYVVKLVKLPEMFRGNRFWEEAYLKSKVLVGHGFDVLTEGQYKRLVEMGLGDVMAVLGEVEITKGRLPSKRLFGWTLGEVIDFLRRRAVRRG